MEYKQTKKYMIHKLNTAFESFTNLSRHNIDNHKAVIEFFENNSDKIKDVSLEQSYVNTDSESLQYTFIWKNEIPHKLYIDLFNDDSAVIQKSIDTELGTELCEFIGFNNLEDLKDFLKTKIFN
jgi:hypothetical protein